MNELLNLLPTRPNRNAYGSKYVRVVRSRTGGVLFQARAWHPQIGSINIGLFRSEREAIQAARDWIRAGCNPCRGLSEGVLPKWVKAVVGGYQSAIIRRRVVVFRSLVHATPEGAHGESAAWYRANPPPPRELPRGIHRAKGGGFMAVGTSTDYGTFIRGPFATVAEAQGVLNEWRSSLTHSRSRETEMATGTKRKSSKRVRHPSMHPSRRDHTLTRIDRLLDGVNTWLLHEEPDGYNLTIVTISEVVHTTPFFASPLEAAKAARKWLNKQLIQERRQHG